LTTTNIIKEISIGPLKFSIGSCTDLLTPVLLWLEPKIFTPAPVSSEISDLIYNFFCFWPDTKSIV